MTHRTLIGRLDLIRSSFPQTPVVQLAHDHLDLFAKLEFSNPNGSAKDRSAHWILEQAVLRGEIIEETTVVESSSGNFAVSLAAFCRMLNLPFLPVIDVNVNPSNETFLQTVCPRVVKISSVDEADGFLLERLRKVRELREEIPCAYWPNQYANPDAVQAHHTLTGGELEKAFGTIDYLFTGVGTGAAIAGLSRRVREFSPGVKVIGVDAEGSIISGGPPKPESVDRLSG